MRKCPTQDKDCHTKASAIRAALRYSRKRGTALRYYYHRDCGSYHLSSRPKHDIHNREGEN